MSYILEDSWITEAGLRATVLYVNKSHRCGYVEVAKLYPDFESFKYETIKIHGNITYIGKPLTGKTINADTWWVGFDCAHIGDGTRYSPELPVRTLKYVKAECESLAKQLAELEQKAVQVFPP